ncbi:coilin [Haematobia irritans]|uniref:coilin n=1 Tax=Haematobia irritans TaxID=7368 RepID=UPI003F4FE54D
MNMSKFGVKIDLSTFFDDERKMVMVMVDVDSWKTVSDLQKRVEALFDIDVGFLHDGCYLPKDEPIEIVRFCKDLKAFVPKEKTNSKKKKKSKKHDEDETERIEEVFNQVDDEQYSESKKKRKYLSLGCDLTSSTPNNSSKRIKNSFAAINATLRQGGDKVNKSSEITSTSCENTPALPIQSSSVFTENAIKQKTMENDKKSHTKSVLEEKSCNENSKTESPTNKTSSLDKSSGDSSHNINANCDNSQYSTAFDSQTKRKSKKNRKCSKKPTENSIELSISPTRLRSLPSSTFITEGRNSGQRQRSSKNPFKNQSSLHTNHIHFNDSGEISTTESNKNSKKQSNGLREKPVIKVVFHCQLDEIDAKKPRVFEINSKSAKTIEETNQRKPLIEIQEDIQINPVERMNVACNQSKTTSKNNDEIDNEEPEVSTSYNAMQEKDNTIQEDDTTTKNDTLNNTDNTKTIIEKSIDYSQADENDVNDHITTEKNELPISTNHANNNGDNDLSIQSVDCVDLSMDGDEENDISLRNRTSKLIQDISISDTSDIEEVIDLNETEVQNNEKSLTSPSRSTLNSTIRVNNIIGKCKEAKDMPNINDIMIFKIPFANRLGNPDCTKFLAGRVERTQQRTKMIKLVILDGHSELFYVGEKYIDRYMDNSQCEEKFINIKFSEMVQPRILANN